MYKYGGPLVTVVTKFCSVAHDIGGSSVLNLRHVTFLAFGNLRWPLGFGKFVHPCFKVHIMGWDSSVGIAIRYGLEGLGTESRWRREFRTRPDQSRGPPALLYTYNGYRVFPGGKAAGAWR